MKLWPFAGKKSAVSGGIDSILRALSLSQQSAAGRPVTTESAIRQSAVFACCTVLAQGVAQVPCVLIKKEGDRRNEARDHPLWRLLHGEPNGVQTSYEFREQIVWNLALLGNAYVLKTRSLDGRQLLELLPLPAHQVECRVTRDLQRSYIWRTGDGNALEINAADIWHLRGPALSGFVGMAAVREAREAIGLSDAMERHAGAVFSRGTRLSGVLSGGTGVKPAEIEALRQQWAELYSGVDNAAKTAILPGPWQWSPTDMSAVDAQLIEQRRFEIEEICRYFRVSPVMVMSNAMTQAYASIEQLFLAHVVHTLMPWYERFQQSAAMNLLTEAEKRDGYSIKLKEQGLLRGALRDQAEYWQRLAGIGVLSPNEIREMNDLNPYPGGDEWRVALNTAAPGTSLKD